MSGPDDREDDGDGDDIRVAEYLLGLTDPAERAAMARRLAEEPALAAQLQLWQQRFSPLDADFAEVPPPAAAFGRLEKRLFGAPARQGWWNSVALWRGLTAAAAAIAVVAIGVNLMRPAPLSPDEFATQLVAALTDQGSGVSFVALYDQRSGTVRLTGLSGAQVPDRDYELWAIEGQNAPVSMGVVPVDASTDVKLSPEMLQQFGAGTVLAVTIEPKGGSPTGGPTGPIVAKGAATPV
jgi:anti-sigma-K factor RskA